jgi:hypothetical protein
MIADFANAKLSVINHQRIDAALVIFVAAAAAFCYTCHVIVLFGPVRAGPFFSPAGAD